MIAQPKARTVHSQVPNGQSTTYVCHTWCHVFLTQHAADSLWVLFILEFQNTEWLVLLTSVCWWVPCAAHGAQPDKGTASRNGMFRTELVLS